MRASRRGASDASAAEHTSHCDQCVQEPRNSANDGRRSLYLWAAVMQVVQQQTQRLRQAIGYLAWARFTSWDAVVRSQ